MSFAIPTRRPAWRQLLLAGTERPRTGPTVIVTALLVIAVVASDGSAWSTCTSR